MEVGYFIVSRPLAWSLQTPLLTSAQTTRNAIQDRCKPCFCCCVDAGSQASLSASALIVELHLRLGPKLKPKAAKIGAGFVDTCLHHLRTSVSRIHAVALDVAPAAVDADGGISGVINKSDDPSDDGGVGGSMFEKMGQLLGAGEGRNGSRTTGQRHDR